jgi:hypothetical protein
VVIAERLAVVVVLLRSWLSALECHTIIGRVYVYLVAEEQLPCSPKSGILVVRRLNNVVRFPSICFQVSEPKALGQFICVVCCGPLPAVFGIPVQSKYSADVEMPLALVFALVTRKGIRPRRLVGAGEQVASSRLTSRGR